MKTGFEANGGQVGILLLHGLSGTPDEVKPLGDYLAQRGFGVLGPWLPGHGTHPRDLAKTGWRDWMESSREALETLGQRCPKVYVAGLSMGGVLALHLAAHYPVSGLISMAAPVQIPDFRFKGIAFFRFLQWRTSQLTGGVLDPEVTHLTYPQVHTASLYELKKLMDSVWKDLPLIQAPALVIQGRKDSMVPPGNGNLIYQRLGSTRKHLLYLDRSDHVVTLDFDRGEVFEKTLNFMRSEGERIDG